MKSIKQIFGGDLRKLTMPIALVALVIIFDIASGGRMITSANFQNLIAGNAYVLVLAIGMLMVIVIGQIDLAVGSVAGFAGMSMALMARDLNMPWWLAVICGLLIGVLAGMWQGFWVAKMNIPGFITTLGGMMIFRGGVIWISRSISVAAPPELKWFGAGHLPEWGPKIMVWDTMAQKEVPLNNSTLLLGLIAILAFAGLQIWKYIRTAKQSENRPVLWVMLVKILLVGGIVGYLTLVFAGGREGTSFPIPGVILVVLVIIYHIITQRTRFGRHIYAVGGNKSAAALSGVNVPRTYFLTMLNMSVLAAFAGIMFVGRSTAAGPSDGTGWELDAIASVFIGGAAVAGGIGTVLATMIGGMVMAVLNSGLMLLGVSSDRTQVIKGLVLLAAVAFDVFNKQQGRRSIIGTLFPGKEGKGKDVAK